MSEYEHPRMLTPEQDRALVELSQTRPIPGKSNLIPTGMKRGSKHAYGNSIKGYQRMLADVREVPIRDLLAVQTGVSRARVRHYVRHPEDLDAPGRTNEAGLLEDLPIVVEHSGKFYLHDGHHRVVAQRLMGRDTVRARVVRIESPMRAWANVA